MHILASPNIGRLTALLSALLVAGCGGGGSSGEPQTENQNTSPAVNLSVTFASTPEQVTLSRHAKFIFSAPDASGYECRVDSEAFSTCDQEVFLVDVGPGAHSFDVRANSTGSSFGATERFDWSIASLFTEANDDLIPTNVVPDFVAPNSWRGIIRINCDFSHSSYNDPIVFPGEEGAAHLHRFYGNTAVDHSTDLETLYTQGESTCQGNLLNLSAYWVPALLAPSYDQITGDRILDAAGEPAWKVVPAVVGNDDEAHEVFYYSAGIDDVEAIQPVPAGLRMIAGEHSTMPGAEQDSTIARWHCQSWDSDDATNPRFSATIPECEAPDRVRMDLFFPSCWDGTNLDSDNHKDHMAYPINDPQSGNTVCPATHPVVIARPSYHYAFGVKPEVYEPTTRSSKGWRLAADMYQVSEATPGGLSLHGDWFNGWHPEIMELLLDTCIKQGYDCHDGNLTNGYRLSGTREGTGEEPPIIDQGRG